jgi:hypothetical protein
MADAAPEPLPPSSSVPPTPPATSAPKAASEPPKPAEPEPLREDEEAAEDAANIGAVALHRTALERLPDDRRSSPAPGTERPSWRRRTYVVDWKLQLSYAGLYVATITLFLVGFAASNLIFFRLLQGAKLAAKLPTREWWQQDDIGFYLVLNFVIVLFVGMGMALWAIVQSHRVAGPALRFRRAFRQILRRDYDFFLTLRKNDFLKELALELNVVNNALKAKDIVLADAVVRLDAVARTTQDPDKAAELHELAQSLADVVLPLPSPEVAAAADPDVVAKA